MKLGLSVCVPHEMAQMFAEDADMSKNYANTPFENLKKRG